MLECFLTYLKCPISDEALTLTVDERRGDRVISGTLASSQAQYPIIRGIPRFVPADRNYAASFGYQWHRWRRVQFESENTSGAMAGHTRNMFNSIAMQPENAFRSGMILDVGCGPGRFIDVIRSYGDAKVIGVDYSSAVEVAAENFKDDKNVLIVQADAMSLPIRPATADGVYSIGVLHHTPDPRKGFVQMLRAAKPGAWLALSVYGKGGFYDDPRVMAYRQLFKFLQPIFGIRAPLWYAYFVAYAIYPLTKLPLIGPFCRVVFPMARLPDVRWRVLDTFDAITPVYQSTHTSYEVFGWFKEMGLVHVEPSQWGFTAWHGKVPESAD